MKRRLTALLLTAGLSADAGAFGEDIATIQLSHRPAEDVAPLIQPLLEPSETVVPNGFMLIIKARPSKIDEIRDLVQRLDLRQHRLMITVAQGRGLSKEALDARAAVQLQVDPQRSRLGFSGHAYQTETTGLDEQTQRVQTLDGQSAVIRFGIEVPRPSQSVIGVAPFGPIIAGQGFEYREASTGFEVTPRLAGDQVTLDIAPWSDRLHRSGNLAIDTQAAQTVLRTRLGEWVEIGGQVDINSGTTGSPLGHHYSTRTESNRIFLRVDDLDAGKR